MKALIQAAFWCTLLISSVSSVGSAQAAEKIFTQTPCGPFVCLDFDHDDVIPVIRSFTFAAPSAGRAQVTFNGTARCGSDSDSDATVDLVSQIVTGAGATPAQDGPGGLRLRVVLKNELDHAVLSFDTFNLASARVITYPSGGNKSVFFKINRFAMDADTACDIYNAAFSVVFIP